MKKLLPLTYILAALTIATYLCGPIRDPDLWWHLVVGRWIYSHQSVPWVDYWTYYGTGKGWVAYSWLFELFVALFEKGFGTDALSCAQTILFISTIFSFLYVFEKISKDTFFALLLSALTAATIAEHFSLRPQALAWLLFLWVIYNGARGNRVPILILLWAWANIHISVGLGIIFLLFTPLRKDKFFLLLCLLTSLATPYGVYGWITALETASHPGIFTTIREFGSASIFYNSVAVFLIVAALFGVLVSKNLDKLSKGALGFSVSITLLGFFIIKFLPFASICLATLIATLWSQAPHEKVALGVRKLEGIGHRYLWFWCFTFAVCVTVNMIRHVFNPVDWDQFPVYAANVLVEKNISGPVINTFADGGYLTYRLANEHGEVSNAKVIIDGRTNLITPEAWGRYNTLMYGHPGWQKIFEEINAPAVIVPRTLRLTKHLIHSGKWCDYTNTNPMALLRCGT